MLRPYPSPGELAKLYATPHDHRRWADHHLRAAVTLDLAEWMVAQHRFSSAADLSCGNGAILEELSVPTKHFGDFALGHEYVGPIEKTIDQIPPVGLFICSETLEHVEEPVLVLKKIRAKSQALILSTPDGEWEDHNPEHVWGWDSDYMRFLLETVGWTPQVHNILDLRPAGYVYSFQIWACL